MLRNIDASGQKKSAVMFTDISGFSKKLIENEVRAFELLKTHDALIRVLTAKFDGKIIKPLGDSFLIEFPNCVNAVRCALEIQKRFWNFNRGKSEVDSIRIRIGIHISETQTRNSDANEEDVIIATRIESLTEPNRICITRELYNAVKDSISLNVFEIGNIEIKEIARNVDVFEILIDSIPELAEPSESAVEASTIRKASFITQLQAEELQEAKRIEEAKQRIIIDQSKTEDERAKTIAFHYARAEAFFEVGQLENAELELAEISKLEAEYREALEQEQKNKRSEQIIQTHLLKARELLEIGNLEEAETEINEIFRIQPLHTDAQQLLMRIEEERYHLEEKKRLQQVESRHQKEFSEEERKIEELLERARNLFKEENYTEATFVLHDIFRIDPNHSTARHLEESIRQAKQAKAEIQRLEEERILIKRPLDELTKVRNLKKKLEERKREAGPVIRRIRSKPTSKKPYYVLGYIISAIVLTWFVIIALEWLFPKTAKIAVLRFTSPPNIKKETDLSNALPLLLAKDFAKCSHIKIVSSTSSLSFTPNPAYLQRISTRLGTDYLIFGTIEENQDQYTIEPSIFISEQEKIIHLEPIYGAISELNNIRRSIIQMTIEKLNIRSDIPAITQPNNTTALAKYLKAINLLQIRQTGNVDTIKTLLESALQLDPSFGMAYTALADLGLKIYLEMEDADFLKYSAYQAQKAIQYSMNKSEAYRILGTYYRLIQNYDSSYTMISRSLTIQPQDAESYRQMALLCLVERDFEEAALQASNAIIYDPNNYDSYFVAGLVQHLKQNYTEADKFYGQAQSLNENNTTLTAYYRQSLWIAQGNPNKVINYCLQMNQIYPEDYRYCYWLGRAYQVALQINSAQEWLKRALTIAHQSIDEDQNDATAYAYAAIIHSRLGQFADGESAINKALEIDNNSAEVLFRKANMYAIQRNKQKAIESLRLALGKQYNFSEILNPDLSPIWNEPEYTTLITKKINTKIQPK